MNIIYISNFKVKANVTIDSEVYRSDFNLDQDLSIKSLGIENDHLLAPDDVSTESLSEYQNAISGFIEEQSKKTMKSDLFGCFYRINKTSLESAAILSSGECDTDWSEVEFPASVQELERINNYFKTNFTEDDFDAVPSLK